MSNEILILVHLLPWVELILPKLEQSLEEGLSVVSGFHGNHPLAVVRHSNMSHFCVYHHTVPVLTHVVLPCNVELQTNNNAFKFNTLCLWLLSLFCQYNYMQHVLTSTETMFGGCTWGVLQRREGRLVKYICQICLAGRKIMPLCSVGHYKWAHHTLNQSIFFFFHLS